MLQKLCQTILPNSYRLASSSLRSSISPTSVFLPSLLLPFQAQAVERSFSLLSRTCCPISSWAQVTQWWRWDCALRSTAISWIEWWGTSSTHGASNGNPFEQTTEECFGWIRGWSTSQEAERVNRDSLCQHLKIIDMFGCSAGYDRDWYLILTQTAMKKMSWMKMKIWMYWILVFKHFWTKSMDIYEKYMISSSSIVSVQNL